jgi:hypothetical protein
MPDPPEYRWRIRVDYRPGNHQAWPCDSEAQARHEFAYYRALHAAGDLPDVVTIRLQRQPIGEWETVRAEPEDHQP